MESHPGRFEPLEQRPPGRRRRARQQARGGDEAEGARVSAAGSARPLDLGGALDGATNFEFLPHTADVLCHAWGPDLPTALAACVLGLNAYQIYDDDLSTVVARRTQQIKATGHDVFSLCYSLLNEANFAFSQGLVSRACRVDAIVKEAAAPASEADGVGTSGSSTWTASATLFGETYKPLGIHGQGTEIKAPTYSSMRIEGLSQANDGDVEGTHSKSEGGTTINSRQEDGVHISVVFDI